MTSHQNILPPFGGAKPRFDAPIFWETLSADSRCIYSDQILRDGSVSDAASDRPSVARSAVQSGGEILVRSQRPVRHRPRDSGVFTETGTTQAPGLWCVHRGRYDTGPGILVCSQRPMRHRPRDSGAFTETGTTQAPGFWCVHGDRYDTQALCRDVDVPRLMLRNYQRPSFILVNSTVKCCSYLSADK